MNIQLKGKITCKVLSTVPGTQQAPSVSLLLWSCGPCIVQADIISDWMLMSVLIIVWGPSRDIHSPCAEGAPRPCSEHREEIRNSVRQGNTLVSGVSFSLSLSYPRSQNIKWKISKVIHKCESAHHSEPCDEILCSPAHPGM